MSANAFLDSIKASFSEKFKDSFEGLMSLYPEFGPLAA